MNKEQKVTSSYLEREIFIVKVQGTGEANCITGKAEDRWNSNKDYERLSKTATVDGSLGKFSSKIEI